MTIRVRHIILLLLGLFVGLDNIEAKVFMEIDFDLVDGRMLISGSVGNERGVYIFDTGSSGIILNTKKISKVDGVMNTLNGDEVAQLRDVEQLDISGYALYNLESVIHMDLSSFVSDVSMPVLGIVGWAVFDEDQPIFIDYPNSKIIIGKPELSTELIGYNHVIRLEMVEIEDDLPTVQIEVNNKKLTFAFDTGAPLHVMSTDSNESMKERLFHENLKLNKYITVEESLFRLENLQDFNEIDGILSVNSLNTDYVIIDRSGNRIFLFWKKDQSL